MAGSEGGGGLDYASLCLGFIYENVSVYVSVYVYMYMCMCMCLCDKMYIVSECWMLYVVPTSMAVFVAKYTDSFIGTHADTETDNVK